MSKLIIRISPVVILIFKEANMSETQTETEKDTHSLKEEDASQFTDAQAFVDDMRAYEYECEEEEVSFVIKGYEGDVGGTLE